MKEIKKAIKAIEALQQSDNVTAMQNAMIDWDRLQQALVTLQQAAKHKD